MSFFFNETREVKAKTPRKVRLQDIPVDSLRKLGCSVCPRDKDKGLKSPKMEPSGARGASVYLLGPSPSEDEDADNNHWTDKAGDAIYQMFGSSFMKGSVRSNFVTQCRGDQTPVEVECCRGRVVSDIEATRPELIVGIGDVPLRWATGMSGEYGGASAIVHRGSLFVVKVGKHVCWFYSILYPNYVNKENQWRKGEFEMALEHDVRRIKGLVGNLPRPRVYEAPYDVGVELITGEGAGDFQRLEDALTELAREPKGGIDFETNGLRPRTLRNPMILTCAVGTFDRVVAFPVDHPTEGWGSDRRRGQVKGLLGEYIMESGRKIAHNLAMEMEWAEYEFGPQVLRRTEWSDTMAMAHTLNERGGTKSLGFRTLQHFGFDLKAQNNLDVKRLLDYPLRDVLRYNGMDSKWTDLLDTTLAPLVKEENQYEYDRKVRLAPTLILTEAVGLEADMEFAQNQKDGLQDSMADAEKKLKRTPEVRDYERKHGTFAATNSDHVLTLYKDVLKRPEVRVEERGKVRWTTEEDQLVKMPPSEVPSASLILEHRAASKLLGTFVEPILTRKIVGRDGRVRCKYSSMVAETGRLASEDPNLQNWPKRKHKDIRGIIVPPPGCWIVPADYGQIEFRVIGMASEDRNLVKYAWTGYDVHGYWAQRIIDSYGPVIDYVLDAFGDEVAAIVKKNGGDEDKAILKTLRQEAKNGWVFPQFFGSSARSCARNLHIPEEIADDLAGEFWDEFRGVKEWQEVLLQKYEKNLYVETLGGRKRRGALTRNQIINHPIQGTAFDIVAEGMNALSEKAEADADPDLQPALNVHDDLTFCIPDENMEAKIPVIAREMCMPRFDFINVPLLVEVSCGKRWHPVEELRVFRSDVLFNTPNPYKE